MVSFVSVPNGAELAFVQGSRTRAPTQTFLGVRDEPLRTSAWKATHVLGKVRPGNGDGMFIFSIPE